jgi:hypothetical protein
MSGFSKSKMAMMAFGFTKAGNLLTGSTNSSWRTLDLRLRHSENRYTCGLRLQGKTTAFYPEDGDNRFLTYVDTI